MNQYLRHHQQAMRVSWQEFCASYLSNSFTILLIAIALALPVSFFFLIEKASLLSEQLQTSGKVSLFLREDASPEQINQLLSSLQQEAHYQQLTYISPEQGLNQLTQQTGAQAMLAELPTNPLPPVIEFSLPVNTPQSEIQTILASLKQMPLVTSTQADIEWLQRFNSLIHLGQRLTVALLILFSSAIFLIISNSIRLVTQRQRQEIKIFNLMGATNGFIRRPFLYTGLFYGLGGSISAIMLTEVVLWWLRQPIQQLMEFYHSNFILPGLGIGGVTLVLLFSVSLGLLSAYLVVTPYLTAAISE